MAQRGYLREYFALAATHPFGPTDLLGGGVAGIAAVLFVFAQCGVIEAETADVIAGWVAVGGLLFAVVSRLALAPLWMLRARDGRILDLERERDGQLAAARDGLERFQADVRLSPALSTLSPVQRVAAARERYQSVLAKARDGNRVAMSQLPGVAKEFLAISRDCYKSSPTYVADERQVQQDVTALLAASGPAATAALPPSTHDP